MIKQLFIKLLGCLLCAMLCMGSAMAVDTITYYHNDAAGTPLLATNQTGEVLWKENFRPYGDKLNHEAASQENKIWFTGKPHDENTGLTYMGARYYDPLLGRFMGIDPIGFSTANLQSFNRYAYANNNPYKFVDPDGRNPAVIAAVGAPLPPPPPPSTNPEGGGASTGLLSPSQVAGKIESALSDTISAVGNMLMDLAFNLGDTKSGEGDGNPRAGEKGGPGEGKDFSEKTKDKVRDRDDNKCVFCKKETTMDPGPNRSEIDHAESKKNGGNNTENNGQNTCRTCNREKSWKSTAEYLEWKNNR